MASSLGTAITGLPAISATDPAAIVSQHVLRLVQMLGFLLIASISGVFNVIVTIWESCGLCIKPPVNGMIGSVVWMKF